MSTKFTPSVVAPAVVLGTTAAEGTAPTTIRSDSTIMAFDATVPVTQASADAAATGSAAVAARRDHKHGMPTIPSAAAGGTPATVIGTAGSAGSAGTFLRTDDTLGVLDATVPTTSALGDAAATGSVAKAARRDHVHGREASGTSAAAIGTSAGGSATTPSKSDHVHATGAGTPSTQAFADTATTGTGPAAAMTDHKHAWPTVAAARTTLGIPQTLFVDYADAGNVDGTGNTDLYTHTLAAGQLAADGDRIDFEVSGLWTFPNTANGQLRAYYGGSVIFDSTSLGIDNNVGWNVVIRIVRVSSTVLRASAVFLASFTADYLNITQASAIKYLSVGSLDHSTTNILKIMGEVTGTGKGSNQIIAKLGTIRYYPAP